VKFVAGQVKADPAMFAGYAWPGRTAEYHRAQLRAVLGFREPVVSDEDKLADWLAAEVCRAEPDRLRLAQCRQERIEPPGPSRIERIVGTAEALCEARFTAPDRRDAGARCRRPVGGADHGQRPDNDAAGGFLQELKADPGQPVTRVSARCSTGTSAGARPWSR
jgi:hypothetical protein